MTVVAVTVTGCPLQIAPEGTLSTIPGVTGLETVMDNDDDVTVAGCAHNAVEVSKQATMSPFDKVDDVNVELLLPAFCPFMVH